MEYYTKNGHVLNNKLYQKLMKETLEYNKNTPLTKVNNINIISK